MSSGRAVLAGMAVAFVGSGAVGGIEFLLSRHMPGGFVALPKAGRAPCLVVVRSEDLARFESAVRGARLDRIGGQSQ